MEDITRLALEFPDFLENLATSTVWEIIRGAKKENKNEALFEFLSSLYQAKYSGPDFETTPKSAVLASPSGKMASASRAKSP